MTPERAFNDSAVILRIDVANVRPALRIDIGPGSLTEELASVRMSLVPVDEGLVPVRLETIDWGDDGTCWVTVAAGLPAGFYTIRLDDPRGQAAKSSVVFEGKGPDLSPPTITVPSLTSNPYVGAGTLLATAIRADDDAGSMGDIHWETSDGAGGDCPSPPSADLSPHAPPPSDLNCTATLTVPSSIVPFSLTVTAHDVVRNEATLDIPLIVANVPTIDSFANTLGGLGGYQPFIVRGNFFMEGAQALIGGVPIDGPVPGGQRRDSHSIVGWTPPRARAGDVEVEVRSAVGVATARTRFTYLPPPRPRDIQPTSGPARGGTLVTVRGNDLRNNIVVVYIGATRDVRKPLYNVKYDSLNGRVVGCVPAAVNTGTVSVWTYDPVSGDGELPMAFTYEDSDTAPALGPPAPPDKGCE